MNDIGSAQKVFYIVVNGERWNDFVHGILCESYVCSTDPPVITSSFPTNVTVLPGEIVHFKCEAIGNPVPVVYWENQDPNYANGS